MSARKKIPYKTSIMVRYVHPTDVSVEPNEPLDNTDDGATASFKVIDHSKEEVISADEASGQTVLSVTNAGRFKVDDVAEVDQNDGTVHASALTAVTPADGTVTLTAGLTAAADAGKRIRCRLGSPVTMTEYGTPALGTRDWGFEGPLPWNHPGLDLDVEVDIEISFDGDPVGGGLEVLEVICAVVKPKEDCSEATS